MIDEGRLIKSILLTRPSGQNFDLISLFTNINAKVYELPAIEIKALSPPKLPPPLPSRYYDRVIFISTNAVQYGWPLVQNYINLDTTLFTIGEGSGKALERLANRPVSYPQPKTDSEALLSMDKWHSIDGLSVLICRGQGGREWLKEALETRGAKVDYLECYIRTQPKLNLSTFDNAMADQAVILIMSIESLSNLWHSLDSHRLDQLTKKVFLVTHERIKDYAIQLGIKRIYLTENNHQAIINTWRKIAI